MLDNTNTINNENLDEHIKTCQSFMNDNKNKVDFNELEKMLLNIKKVVARSALPNTFAFIEKTVETGAKALDGMNKQFNVFSIQITPNDEIFLITREVLGVDISDKKFVLDNETTHISLKDVIRVF